MQTSAPLKKLWSLLWPPADTTQLRPQRRERGTCRVCDRPIAGVRLKLMPTADLCAPCQKAVDARALIRRGG